MNQKAFRTNRSALAIRSIYLLLLTAAFPVLIWNPLVQQMNASLNDILLWRRGQIHSQAVDDIVLAAIDDTTAAQYGPLPLRRSVLAKGISRLASLGPRAVALDLLLGESGPPEDDADLSDALRVLPGAVLSAALGSDPRASHTWILPLPEFAGPHRVGHVHVEPDADGSVRSIPLEEADAGRRLWAIGLEVVRTATHAEAPLERNDSLGLGGIRIPASASSRRLMLINYAGPEGAFRRIPFSALLDGSADFKDFRGKIVFLGVTAQGGGDRIFTPLSARIGMSGIEIHANVARTILDRDFLTPLSESGTFAALILIAGISVLGIGALRGMRLHAALAALAFLIVVSCFAGLRLGYVLPLGTLLAGFAFAGSVAGLGEYAIVTTALHRAERRQREYATRVQAIAHEIKTPLTAIQGSSEIISDQDMPEDQRAAIASMIHKESKRLTQIIHTFLDVERMAAGSLALQKQPLDLASLCDEVLERARLYGTRKSTTITAAVPHITVAADLDLLSFAIYNLLTNAIKYSPKRTTVTLSAQMQSGTLRISVVDQGLGIAPAEQKKIFDRFYRVQRSQPDNEEGTGIGLALVKEIVSQHGGRIEVDSQEGRGSRFTIVLPGQST
ncbi:MAG TPA: CHASE2 domain-containing protein [Bryobacteraceae bacterium]|nr:CHASE2 domain-containing protein [Bryobacteraceae bacterium]